MNRQQRRAMKGKTFGAKCLMCEADGCLIHVLERRAIYASDPTAPQDVGICKGCPCSTGKCVWCGETEGHWLGCSAVGLPSTGGPEAIQ